MDKTFDNNQVTLSGIISSPFRFSHGVFGEGFYLFDLSVGRLSESCDIIPVMISERLVDVNEDMSGRYVEVNGQFRSYNHHEENRNRLVLSVFAREVNLPSETNLSSEANPSSEENSTSEESPSLAGTSYSEGESMSSKPNYIFLDGYVCKPPIYRKTPLGREIADILLAVNRPYGKSDYIPCICWGRNARYADTFEVGGHVQIWGRIQSREYQKKLSETEFEKRIAYEVSVSKLDYLS